MKKNMKKMKKKYFVKICLIEIEITFLIVLHLKIHSFGRPYKL